MTTPTFCTFDGDPLNAVYPARPTVDEMGGAAFVDDDLYPPVPEQNVTAADVNEMQNLLTRACRMIPTASFWVRKNGATMTLLGFKSCNDLLLNTDISVSTDGGNNMIIQWPRHKLPAGVVPPMVCLVSSSAKAYGTPNVRQTVDSTYQYVVAAIEAIAGGNATVFTLRIDVDGEGTFGD